MIIIYRREGGLQNEFTAFYGAIIENKAQFMHNCAVLHRIAR
ncbi:hypothetical protein SAMN05443094_103151 [Domibacillus enclensis]|uniref:Uncharacterized protein n=1 Tax=Domibacillus enclensis TaxID=1017273 RepID=A0A1N6U369_9BACI|nr:hypothetical protein SAMN05443094_103151 [Domibacillus enclensis]